MNFKMHYFSFYLLLVSSFFLLTSANTKQNSSNQTYKTSPLAQSQKYKEEIRNYVKKIFAKDPVNTKDICDTFDLCTKGMTIQTWQVSRLNPKKIAVDFIKPFQSQMLYRNIPVKFSVKQRVEVEFSEEGTAKVMTFANEALKGTKIINIYISRVEFNNHKDVPNEHKMVTLDLGLFIGERTVIWKLEKLHTVLKTIRWP